MNNGQKFAPLDLSKLKPCQLPLEACTVRLKGDVDIDPETGEKIQNVQNIPIHPLSGAGMIAWGENRKNDPDSVMFEERACLTALIYGADIPEEEAKMLIEYDRSSAIAISQAVWVATSRWNKAQRAEEETAEKNSEPAETSMEN